MHIANYLGPLTFIEVTICGMPHVTRVLKLIIIIIIIIYFPSRNNLHGCRIFETFTRLTFVNLVHNLLVRAYQPVTTILFFTWVREGVW